jgi:hypothetical protein
LIDIKDNNEQSLEMKFLGGNCKLCIPKSNTDGSIYFY